MIHEPILLKTILHYFSPNPGDNFIDATAGEGGHAIPIAQKVAPRGKVLAIDTDLEQIKNLQLNAPKNIVVEHGNFKNIKQIVQKNNFPIPKGILFDLGFSSWHIQESGRGFTFNKNEPLDMRFDPTDDSIPTAGEILNSATAEELENIFKLYGEEKMAKQIAREIVKTRRKEKLQTTGDLVNLVAKIKGSGGRINPATKIFQALRIAVNNELENIKQGITAAIEILGPEGLIAVMTFHSLEDRLVKNIFKTKETEGVGHRVNKKVIRPDYKEVKQNPRARSVKLRIFQINKS